MKLIHLSDLHIGKRVNEYSMLEDQQYILKEILGIIDEERPDCVIIAGDVYDKSIPPAEAVSMFDDFLVKLAQRELKVFVISGNHDSPERIAFGGRLMNASGIYMSRVYDGETEPITLSDEYGNVNIYMLPFIKPIHVRRYNENAEIESYTDALRVAIDGMDVNEAERNVMVTHQFVTGSERTESEEISVGGTDNVDVAVFEKFDYTALGHIHRAQNCSSEKVRYSGTPLKYSFSEAKDKKSVTVVELLEKGNMSVREVPLVPLRDMHEIKGTYEELMSRSFYENTPYCGDYIHITLTDEDEVYDAIGRLRSVYKNIMKLDYDNTRTRSRQAATGAERVEEKHPLIHFEEFYLKQNERPMDERQSEFVGKLIEEIWGGEQ